MSEIPPEERAAVLRRLGNARVGHLATSAADGRPHVVPLCFAIRGEVAYTVIDAKPKDTTTGLRRLRNIRENPRAMLLADHYEEDWSRLWYVMAEGGATLVHDEVEYETGLTALREKYETYRRLTLEPGTNPMIRLQIERLIAWQGGRS